jgi:hypothetical protein
MMEDYPLNAPNDDGDQDMHNELLGAAYEPGFFFENEIVADEEMGAPHIQQKK